eukprot:scaffold2298_cov388-Prasinococcus_capsulatus_cf.AAC.12
MSLRDWKMTRRGHSCLAARGASGGLRLTTNICSRARGERAEHVTNGPAPGWGVDEAAGNDQGGAMRAVDGQTAPPRPPTCASAAPRPERALQRRAVHAPRAPRRLTARPAGAWRCVPPVGPNHLAPPVAAAPPLGGASGVPPSGCGVQPSGGPWGRPPGRILGALRRDLRTASTPPHRGRVGGRRPSARVPAPVAPCGRWHTRAGGGPPQNPIREASGREGWRVGEWGGGGRGWASRGGSAKAQMDSSGLVVAPKRLFPPSPTKTHPSTGRSPGARPPASPAWRTPPSVATRPGFGGGRAQREVAWPAPAPASAAPRRLPRRPE